MHGEPIEELMTEKGDPMLLMGLLTADEMGGSEVMAAAEGANGDMYACVFVRENKNKPLTSTVAHDEHPAPVRELAQCITLESRVLAQLETAD
ncbi:unnamed protein product [Cylicocyclus nassatus]|uniref:Uncharacterized protein n=1 Tax=Cylicocyclus nassatus TaxID=53992 RepID=A0AA36MBP9_CYLNA|nr:unnamed protein product [Cylicocyclus nassatus]